MKVAAGRRLADAFEALVVDRPEEQGVAEECGEHGGVGHGRAPH